MFTLQFMSEPGAESLEAYQNTSIDLPQYLAPTNVFTNTLQETLGFTTSQVHILDEDGYYTQYLVLYWNFTEIREWCQLKYNIPESRGGISFVDRNIKCPQELAWWVMDLTLQVKNINLNSFNSDILSSAIEEYQINFEDTRYGKEGISNPKYLSHEKWDQWEDTIYNYLSSPKNSCDVTLSYVIRKDAPSP